MERRLYSAWTCLRRFDQGSPTLGAGGARRLSSAEEGEGAARRPVRGRSSSPASRLAFTVSNFFVCLSAALTLLFAPGCDGDAGKKSGKGDDDPAELQTSVDGLLEQVKKSGAEKGNPEDLEKIVSYIEKAATASEKGKAADQTKNLKLAERALKTLAAEQEKAQDAVKKLAPLKAAAEEAKKKADTQKAAQNAPEAYRQGVDALAKAAESAARGTVGAANQAKSLYERAKDNFEQAVASSKENAQARVGAEEEKKAMLSQKDKAKEKDAEHKAASEWTVATQTEREAERQLSKGEFASATETYKSAQAQFSEALQALARNDEEDARIKAAKEEEAKLLAAQLDANKNRGQGGDGDTPRPKATVKPVAGPAPPTASVTFPDGFNPAAEYLKQELDAEDEEFLTTNIAKLCPSGKLEYDISTGAVSIDYTIGDDVRKDAILSDPTMKKENLIFKMPIQMPGTKGLDLKDKKKMAPFSFQGNTQGMILFPIPFRFYCRVEFDMQVLTMDQANNFNVFVMYQKAKGGYMTDWCRTGTTKSLSNAGIPKKFLGSANDWFDKVNQKPMVIQYLLSDPKTGTLTNVYNNDETATEKDDKLTVKLATTQFSRGQVGFKWSRVKFSAIALQLSGLLDKQAAVDMLRTKLKVKKTTPAKEKAEDKSQPKPAPKAKGKDGGENPTAPPGEGEGGGESGDAQKQPADATKKPAGKIDY